MRTFIQFLKEQGLNKKTVLECEECMPSPHVGSSSGPGSKDEKWRKLRFAHSKSKKENKRTLG